MGRRREVLSGSFLLSACVLGCQADVGQNAPVSRSDAPKTVQSAVIGALVSDDVNTPDDNVVVEVGGASGVLLTPRNASDRRHQTFEVGGFFGAGCYPESDECLLLRPLLNGGSVPFDSYLFRGVYLEPDAYVMPVLEWNAEHARFALAARRVPRAQVVVGSPLLSTFLRWWME